MWFHLRGEVEDMKEKSQKKSKAPEKMDWETDSLREEPKKCSCG